MVTKTAAVRVEPPELVPCERVADEDLADNGQLWELKNQAINLLDRCRLNGYAPEEIINRSIANGWQGLFEPDGQAKRCRDTGQEDLHWNSLDAWRDFL